MYSPTSSISSSSSDLFIVEPSPSPQRRRRHRLSFDEIRPRPFKNVSRPRSHSCERIPTTKASQLVGERLGLSVADGTYLERLKLVSQRKPTAEIPLRQLRQQNRSLIFSYRVGDFLLIFYSDGTLEDLFNYEDKKYHLGVLDLLNTSKVVRSINLTQEQAHFLLMKDLAALPNKIVPLDEESVALILTEDEVKIINLRNGKERASKIFGHFEIAHVLAREDALYLQGQAMIRKWEWKTPSDTTEVKTGLQGREIIKKMIVCEGSLYALITDKKDLLKRVVKLNDGNFIPPISVIDSSESKEKVVDGSAQNGYLILTTDDQSIFHNIRTSQKSYLNTDGEADATLCDFLPGVHYLYADGMELRIQRLAENKTEEEELTIEFPAVVAQLVRRGSLLFCYDENNSLYLVDCKNAQLTLIFKGLPDFVPMYPPFCPASSLFIHMTNKNLQIWDLKLLEK